MTRPAGYLIETRGLREGMPGVFCDYIMAANGLFLQANNEHMAASVCIAPAEVRGLAPLQEYIQLHHGRIPLRFLELALSVLCASPDVERYLAVTWQDGCYSLREPDQVRNAGSVTYETLPGTVLDLHSHTGSMPAHFSCIDNRDEQGFRIYCVVSGLRSLFPEVELRCGVYGYFLPVSKEEIFVSNSISVERQNP